MNHFISARKNILYSKVDGEYKKFHEIILLMQDNSYDINNGGQITKTKVINECRFMLSDNLREDFFELLENLFDADEDELE